MLAEMMVDLKAEMMVALMVALMVAMKVHNNHLLSFSQSNHHHFLFLLYK
jgi:hypothetical protein